MNISLRFSIAVISVGMLSCNTNSDRDLDHTHVDTSSKEAQSTSTLPKVVDSLQIPTFEIEVKLSDKAESKIKEDKETIIVSAFFSGLPIDTSVQEYIEGDKVVLKSHQVELQGSGIAKFEGIKIPKAYYDALSDHDYEVSINVFSGRKASEGNILSCEILQLPISKVKGQKHILKGKLIGE